MQLSNKIFLQTINIREMIYYDTRTEEIARDTQLDELSLTPRYGSWRTPTPMLYLDRDLTADRTWILRVGVMRRAYVLEQLKNILFWIPLSGLLIIAYALLMHLLGLRTELSKH